MTALSARGRSTRVRTVSSIGTIVIALLVLVFGNEAFVEWVREHHNKATAGDYLLNVLTYPSWEFFPDTSTDASVREWFARALRAILIITFVAVLLSVGSRSLLSRGTSAFGGFIFGWGATIIASAVAGFVAMLVLIDIVNTTWLLRALQTAALGAAYGLFFGWLVGAASSGARRG
jgi:hypothetical protein